MSYDSTKDTQEHIENVRSYLQDIIENLWARQIDHDASKLQSPEKEMFDEFTPKLKALTYGSNEYKACLKDMGQALKHHYEANSHHPEHYKMWQCPVCESVFPEKDAPEAVVFKGIRLCPKCCVNGTIMECALEPTSGVYGMSLFDIVEMLADWKAAGQRHADGDLRKSLEINKARFEISDQLFEILINTARELGWIQ